MNFRRRNRLVGEVYTASLNDIMFFLLLFFLITSTLATPNVLKLLLPSAKSSSQSVKHPLTISVTADLQYAINNTPVPADQLEAAIEQAIKGQPDPTALLRSGGSFGDVRRIEATVRHRLRAADFVEAWQAHLTLRREAGAGCDRCSLG